MRVDVRLVQARRVGEPCQPVAAERRPAPVAADQHRRDEPSHDVDRARLDEGAREPRPALDEHRLDPALGERGEDGRNLWTQRRQRHHLHAGSLQLGHTVPRGVRPDGDVDRQLARPRARSAESSGSRANESNTTRTGWRTGPARPAGGQLRVVGERRADADGDGVVIGAQPVHERPRLGPGDPLALAGAGGDLPVQARGQLEHDVRPAAHGVR